MIQTASSMGVKDVVTGKLLLSMRFSGLASALDYLNEAQLVCSTCGKRFGGNSTVTMMNRGESWELMLPHHCEVSPVVTECVTNLNPGYRDFLASRAVRDSKALHTFKAHLST